MYPFGDDIAFRENSDTLKVFKCEFDYEFVEMINELVYRKKFKGLSSLEWLEVNKVNKGEEEITQQCAEAMYRFVRQFGSNKVRKLRIDYSGVANLVMKQIWADAKEKDDGWRNSIRDLSVAGVDLKYTQVLDLLKALPNLERLTSGIIENDPLEEEELLEDTSSLLDSIHKEYWLMFPKFRLWVMNSEKIENVEHCAIYSMLIGVACSGFHGIHITRAHVMEYRETLKILTAMYPYKKYPWLSKRLLPGINWRRTAKK
ncbi:hypothetical protein EV175_005700 [Coemansia sp. RSA 1933]|nr:hypothetical protein EV175_005700 [Coemansia sp. RSA 1933]